MPEVEFLHRAEAPLRGIDLEDHLQGGVSKLEERLVTRQDGSTVSLSALSALMVEFESRRASGDWDGPASDAWLAPRIHDSLRLTRAHASDRGIWHWVALRVGADYVSWRWAGGDGVTDDRWWGAINKQAFARLWWGAELFRDGSDYGPVERAFRRQDLINSYLHRPLVRCRSFALGIVDVLTDDEGGALSAKSVNDLARVLNLCTAGRPPELYVNFQADDEDAVARWTASDAPVPVDWNRLPGGPMALDTTHESREGGRSLAGHGKVLAGF